MAKLSNSKLEQLAVHAIRCETNKPLSKLVAHIPEGDKGISFDGEIEVFIDDSQTVASLYGSVAVQVKGTEVEFFSQRTRSFSLELGHYENFYSKSGTLLLVVEIIATDHSTRIFYKHLLPQELLYIINTCKQEGRKSKSVILRPLDETTLDIVCFRFLQEQKYQPPILVEKNPLHELEFDEYNVRSLTYNPYHPSTSNLLEHEFTVYGKIDNLEVPIIFGKIGALSRTVNEVIVVDDTVYDIVTTITLEDDSYTWDFENVFAFTYNQKTQKFHLDQKSFHSLTTQLKVMPMILGLLNGKMVKIGKNEFRINRSEASKFLSDMQQVYKLLLDLKKVYEIYGINEDRVVHEVEGRIPLLKGFVFWTRATLYNDLKGLSLADPDQSCFVNLTIGDLTIVCFYISEEKKLVNIFNDLYYTKPIKLVSKEDPTINCIHSFFVLMNTESFSYAENINYEFIRKSFDSFDPFINQMTYERTIEFCLQCISVYDQINNKDLLYLADYILRKYKNIIDVDSSDMNDIIVKVNQLQINKRLLGSLTPEEVGFLIDLKSKSSLEKDTEVHFCINVLLDNRYESERALHKLKVDRKQFYETLPIMNLYNKLMQ